MQQITNLADMLLRVKQIIGDSKAGIPAIIPVSKATWYDGVKTGKYPPPDVRLGPKTVCWRRSTIQAVIDGTWKGGAA